MAYNRMGVGGAVVLILVGAAKFFLGIDLEPEGGSPPSSQNSPSKDYAQKMRDRMEADMERQRQQHDQMFQHRNTVLQNTFSQQRDIHQSFHEQTQRRNEQLSQTHQRLQDSLHNRPTVTHPSVPQTPTLPKPASPNQPTFVPLNPKPSANPAANPGQATADAQAAVPKVVKPFDYSPKPDDALLQRYETWQGNNTYTRFLGEVFEFGDWRFQPSREFELQRTNSRTAKWGAGKAGIGLDADLFKLYPRDRGMTCPVHEDTETKQVFRLGRREIRAKGDAEVTHLESNGLLIWRIHTPAKEGDRFGSCYYMAILGEEDAILFTCRYAADKPEQIAAYDAVVQTLEYVQAKP